MNKKKAEVLEISLHDDEMEMNGLSNPEGFPCCPKCGEFVDCFKLQEDYYCPDCDSHFPFEEAID